MGAKTPEIGIRDINLIKQKLNTLCQAYGVTEEYFFELIKSRTRLIPVEIFSQGFPPLESIVSFLKTRQGHSFSKIARLLNRDPRTIWLTYQNAVSRSSSRGSISIPQKSKAEIPLELFRTRELSILESVVLYLHEGTGMSVREIVQLLNKSQSTIRTVLRRAKTKGKANE